MPLTLAAADAVAEPLFSLPFHLSPFDDATPLPAADAMTLITP
jgi:hypothetical protein